MAFNKIKPAKIERLAILLEELGEAQHMIGKILRHGYDSYNSFKPEAGTNKYLLECELGDVVSAIRRLIDADDLDAQVIDKANRAKDERIMPYLHHQTTNYPKKLFSASYDKSMSLLNTKKE